MAWTSSQARAAFRLPLKAIICGWAEFLMGFFLSALTVQVPDSVNMHFKKHWHTRPSNRSFLAAHHPCEVEQLANRTDKQVLDPEREQTSAYE